MEPMRLRLEGLNQIDVIDLKEQFGDSEIEVMPPQPPDGARHGDFGLSAAVIILGPPAITALATWLSKKRVTSVNESNFQIQMKPDGTMVVNAQFLTSSRSSGPPNANTVKSLTAGITDMVEKAASALGLKPQ